ncbi:MAG: hypothetical protein GY863_14695 [bacterium]|nr:hypothetical protein [bacterium]
MNSRLPGLFLGLSLVIVGILVILRNYYYLDFSPEALISVFFFFGSIFFYSKYFSGNNNIAWLILGSVLLMAAFSIFAANSYDIKDEFIAVAALWIVGTTFLVPYLRNRKLFYLVIPIGVLYTVGAALFYLFYDYYSSHTGFLFILFIGFAVTFGILFFMKNEERKLGWAAFPAVIFLVLAAFFGLMDTFYFMYEDYIFPVVIIIIGLFLLGKSLLAPKPEETEDLTVKE